MENIIIFLKYLILFYICLVDIKKKIICEKSFLFLIILGFIVSCIEKDITNFYIGICVFSMPLLILYITEDYINKELIGFGDIKLTMAIGGFLKYKMIEDVINFYFILYLISGIIAIFLVIYFKFNNKKIKYIPFAPFIVVTYIIFIYFYK